MTSPPAPESPGPQPLWHPPGVKLDALPKALRIVLAEIINPAYQELVREAPSALERTSGLTYLNLVWLEMVEQYNLSTCLWQKGPNQISAEVYAQTVAGHLRLIGVRDKVAQFILRAKAARAKYAP